MRCFTGSNKKDLLTSLRSSSPAVVRQAVGEVHNALVAREEQLPMDDTEVGRVVFWY